MNVNLVILAGNLTREPEARQTPGGKTVAGFGLAVNRHWTNSEGKACEEVSYFDCVAFDRTADNIVKFFHKGDPIYIEGRLRQESWDDKTTGHKKYAIKVYANSFQFCGVQKRDGDQPPARKPNQVAGKPVQRKGQEPPDTDAGGDDEYPNAPF